MIVQECGWDEDLKNELQNLKENLKKAEEAYHEIYNHVGVKITDDKTKSIIKNDTQAKEIFGERVGTWWINGYACHDSILLKQTLTYSLIAETSDVFALRLPKAKFLTLMPEVVQEKLLHTCDDITYQIAIRMEKYLNA